MDTIGPKLRRTILQGSSLPHHPSSPWPHAGLSPSQGPRLPLQNTSSFIEGGGPCQSLQAVVRTGHGRVPSRNFISLCAVASWAQHASMIHDDTHATPLHRPPPHGRHPAEPLPATPLSNFKPCPECSPRHIGVVTWRILQRRLTSP